MTKMQLKIVLNKKRGIRQKCPIPFNYEFAINDIVPLKVISPPLERYQQPLADVVKFAAHVLLHDCVLVVIVLFVSAT